ncbi:MAG TPA: cytochrome C [Geobacteraceae bacterium]
MMVEKVTVISKIVIFACLMYGGSGLAAPVFHNGGRGSCSGCHGRPSAASAIAFGNNSSNMAANLKGGDPTSTCLACHEAPIGTRQPQEYFVATNEADMPPGLPPAQLTPGGDFGWLKKNYPSSDGSTHGHNLASFDLNAAGSSDRTAPGGNYPASALTCISCHDPHGNYRRSADGNISTSGLPIMASGSYNNSPDPDANGTVGTYRLLAGRGYQPKYIKKGNYAFTADPPAAVAPANYNRAEVQTDTRVAYGSGMSEWCKNCHKIAHGDSEGHPAGSSARFSQEHVDNYMAGATFSNISGVKIRKYYSSLVPFEMGTRDYALLKATANSDGSNVKGPAIYVNVMCLSCHRAHASAWDFMTRGAMLSSLDLRGRSKAEIQRAFYNRSDSLTIARQKSLCNRCHMME